MIPSPNLVPFDFFYILIDPSDPLAAVFSFLTFSPFLIGFVLLFAVAARRDFHAAICLTGLILGTAINTGLKEYFQHPRPENSFKLGFGMPSDHAQFMTFFAIYWIKMKFYYKHSSNPVYFDLTQLSLSKSFSTRLNDQISFIFPFLLIIFSLSVIFTRHYFRVHTPNQLFVGILVGFLNSFLYFQLLFSKNSSNIILLDRLENSKISRCFFMKNFFKIPNSLEFEYGLYQNYLNSELKNSIGSMNSKEEMKTKLPLKGKKFQQRE